MKPNLFCVVSGAAVLALFGGCVAPMPRVKDSLTKDPAAYTQIAFTPVVLYSAATLDTTLTLAELNQMSAAVGTNIVEALNLALQAKGYEPASTPLLLANDEDWEKMDRETSEVFKEVKGEFHRVSQAIVVNASKDYGKPFEYAMGARLGDLQKALGMPETATIVLFDARMQLESKGARDTRTVKNLTIGLLAGVYLYSPSQISYRMAVIDGRTHELLWFNWALFPEVTATEPKVVEDTLKSFLRKLPAASATAVPEEPRQGSKL